jgi:hypothetical protein
MCPGDDIGCSLPCQWLDEVPRRDGFASAGVSLVGKALAPRFVAERVFAPRRRLVRSGGGKRGSDEAAKRGMGRQRE